MRCRRALKGRARQYRELNQLRRDRGVRRLQIAELNQMTSEQLARAIWNMRADNSKGSGSLFA